MLIITSLGEIKNDLLDTRSARKRTWDNFLSSGTNHSASASTLPYIMRRCEKEKIPYVLKAHPGMGYYIERVGKWNKKQD